MGNLSKTIAVALSLMLATPALAQTPTRYVESHSTAAAQAAYFYAFYPRSEGRVSVIIAFNPEHQLDGAAVLWITQTINCETRAISTERYQAYGADGALLHERANIPSDIAVTIGAEIWSTRLNSRCDPPTPQPITVAPDPPPAYDRRFDGSVSNAQEAVAILRERAEARVAAASLSEAGRWGTYTGRRLTGGAYIDYASSDTTHMSYLAVAGVYDEDWSYERARYAVDCAAQTASVDYLARYDQSGALISTQGPTRAAPMSMMLARDALATYCENPAPPRRTYRTLPEALRALRQENDRH